MTHPTHPITPAGAGRIARSWLLIVVLICVLAIPSFAPGEAAPQRIRTEPMPAGSLPAGRGDLAPDTDLSIPATAPGDEFWAAGFSIPGMDGLVRALAVGPDGQVYVGGQSTTAGDKVSSNIALWTGEVVRRPRYFPLILRS